MSLFKAKKKTTVIIIEEEQTEHGSITTRRIVGDHPSPWAITSVLNDLLREGKVTITSIEAEPS